MNFVGLKSKVSALEARIREKDAKLTKHEHKIHELTKGRELGHLHEMWLRRGVELSEETYSRLINKIKQLTDDNGKLASTVEQETALQYTLKKHIDAQEKTLKQYKIQINFAHQLLKSHGLSDKNDFHTDQTVAEMSSTSTSTSTSNSSIESD